MNRLYSSNQHTEPHCINQKTKKNHRSSQGCHMAMKMQFEIVSEEILSLTLLFVLKTSVLVLPNSVTLTKAKYSHEN